MSRLLALLVLLGSATGLSAQRLQGTFDPPALAGQRIVLLATRGSHHVSLDSTAIGRDGTFAFHAPLNAAGFYQLAVHDSDRVDLILDPREPLVDVAFSGLPLQRNIRIVTSDENKRLWEYKLVSRESQAIEAAAAQEKRQLQPTDVQRLAELDSTVARAQRMRTGHFARLLQGAPDSYFARVVRADLAVEAAQEQGPMAVARAFDFSAPPLLRTSVYDKAVMTFLRNVNVVSPDQFMVASDTLMALAAPDPECRAYMLDHLIELFSTYGPDMALQYLIDRYVAPAGSSAGIDPALRSRVDALLKVAVGATAPDIALNDGGRQQPLSSIVRQGRYTALFFYSSTCDHCHAQMPGVKQDYATFHAQGFEVVGIALDADSIEFSTSIRENAIPWRCYSEFNGWGSTAAKAFQVKATPTFFLLDDRMRIVAKPYDAEELAQELRAWFK